MAFNEYKRKIEIASNNLIVGDFGLSDSESGSDFLVRLAEQGLVPSHMWQIYKALVETLPQDDEERNREFLMGIRKQFDLDYVVMETKPFPPNGERTFLFPLTRTVDSFGWLEEEPVKSRIRTRIARVLLFPLRILPIF